MLVRNFLIKHLLEVFPLPEMTLMCGWLQDKEGSGRHAGETTLSSDDSWQTQSSLKHIYIYMPKYKRLRF